MSSPSNQSGPLYHYASNGLTKGPFTARQLKQLADAGQIQPQTLVWKEGFSEWVLASRLRGLLAPAAVSVSSAPSPSGGPMVTSRDSQPLLLQAGDNPALRRQPRTAVLIGVIAAGLGLLGLIIMTVVLLVSTGAAPVAPAGKDPAAEKSEPPPKTEPPKKSLPPEPKPEPKPAIEITAFDLLKRFQTDPRQTLAELKGKQVLLKVEATWEVESLEKCFDGQGNLRFTYGRMKQRTDPQPNEVFCFRFPLADPKEKLSFISKIKEYAQKQKRGDKVFMQVTGTVSTLEMNGKEFLLIDQAVLQ